MTGRSTHMFVIGAVLALLWIGGEVRIPAASPLGLLAEAMAEDPASTGSVTELLASAQQYEKEAEAHLAEAKRYADRAAGIDPLTDTKGYRRTGLIIAEESHRTLALELQTRARIHRITAERLQEQGIGR